MAMDLGSDNLCLGQIEDLPRGLKQRKGDTPLAHRKYTKGLKKKKQNKSQHHSSEALLDQ